MVKGKKRGLLAVTAAVLALVLGCGIYVEDYYRAEEVVLAMPASVSVETTDNRTVFVPEEASAGLIFYPGGKVEYAAYAPLMVKLAEQNVLCVLLKMPLNLAVLDMDAAAGIPEQFPEVETWYLAGHSLGGSMAASFAGKQADTYDGLILLAAYSTEDLTETGLKVCSLYGDRDGVLNLEKYREYRKNLPEDTLELVLEGGNHAGFGSYGHQEGDGVSTLESGAQIQWTADRILEFIRKLPNHLDIEVDGRKFYLVHGKHSDYLEDRIWERPKATDPPPFEDRTAIVGHTPVCYLTGNKEEP